MRERAERTVTAVFVGEKTFVCLHLCVCVKLQEGDYSCSGSRVEVAVRICQGSVGAKTEEFILALHGEPIRPLEEQGKGDMSESLCPFS